MEISLSIDIATCIRCGRCVRVCPAVIFKQSGTKQPVGLQNISTCIGCGHCVDACPTGSVRHSEFPVQKVHPVDRTQLPTPEQVLLLCRARRSNRAFTSAAIPGQKLDMIVEAAHRAPTASNQQQVGFTLVTDPANLKRITDFTIGVFGSVVRKLENPLLRPLLKVAMGGVYRYLPNFHRLIDEHAAGRDLILRGATAVLLIHAPKDSRFGCQDANLAYQNASLMAETLGVSQFYTGFVCSAIHQAGGRLERLLGIDGTVYAGMALGIPAFSFPNYVDRREIDLRRI